MTAWMVAATVVVVAAAAAGTGCSSTSGDGGGGGRRRGGPAGAGTATSVGRSSSTSQQLTVTSPQPLFTQRQQRDVELSLEPGVHPLLEPREEQARMKVVVAGTELQLQQAAQMQILSARKASCLKIAIESVRGDPHFDMDAREMKRKLAELAMAPLDDGKIARQSYHHTISEHVYGVNILAKTNAHEHEMAAIEAAPTAPSSHGLDHAAIDYSISGDPSQLIAEDAVVRAQGMLEILPPLSPRTEHTLGSIFGAGEDFATQLVQGGDCASATNTANAMLGCPSVPPGLNIQ